MFEINGNVAVFHVSQILKSAGSNSNNQALLCNGTRQRRSERNERTAKHKQKADTEIVTSANNNLTNTFYF